MPNIRGISLLACAVVLCLVAVPAACQSFQEQPSRARSSLFRVLIDCDACGGSNAPENEDGATSEVRAMLAALYREREIQVYYDKELCMGAARDRCVLAYLDPPMHARLSDVLRELEQRSSYGIRLNLESAERELSGRNARIQGMMDSRVAQMHGRGRETGLLEEEVGVTMK